MVVTPRGNITKESSLVNPYGSLVTDNWSLNLVRAVRRKRGFGLFFVQCNPVQEQMCVEALVEGLPGARVEQLAIEPNTERLFWQIEELWATKPFDVLVLEGLEREVLDYEETHGLKNANLTTSERTHRILQLKDLLQEKDLDKKQQATLLYQLGHLYYIANKWNDAIDCYEESLEFFQEVGAPRSGSRLCRGRHGEGKTLTNLGIVYKNQGRWNDAIDWYENSLKVFQEVGDTQGEGQTLANLGRLYEEQGKIEKAVKHWQHSLTKLHPDSPETQTVREWVRGAR